MSSFGDQLRGSVAKKQADTRSESEAEAARLEAARERRMQADAAAVAIVADVFAPLLAEFQEVMQAGGVFREVRLREEHPGRMHPDHGHHRLIAHAYGTAPGRNIFEVRLVAAIGEPPLIESGAMELTAECVRNGMPDHRRKPTWHPLVELSSTKVTAIGPHANAARQWCEGVLKQCAEAVMDENFRAFTAARAPVHAPIVAAPLSAGLSAMSVQL